jgi:hypothetical protein
MLLFLLFKVVSGLKRVTVPLVLSEGGVESDLVEERGCEEVEDVFFLLKHAPIWIVFVAKEWKL